MSASKYCMCSPVLSNSALVILHSSAFFPSDSSLAGSRIHLLAELALGAHLLAANR